MLRTTGYLFGCIALLASAVAAEDRTIDIRFPPGTSGTTLTNSLIGRDTVLYTLGAEAGQTMRVVLTADNAATSFNVYAPGSGPGDAALGIGEMTDPPNVWTGTLPGSGDYTISVFLNRAAARRDERAAYSLDVSVTGDAGEGVTADYADGLAGGPDVWAVAVADGGSLNLRAEPSAGAAVLQRLPNGETLRNLGCRMAEGRRWCRIATRTDPATEGWAAGDFLIEGSATTPVSR